MLIQMELQMFLMLVKSLGTLRFILGDLRRVLHCSLPGF
jgi:hypothetical protein